MRYYTSKRSNLVYFFRYRMLILRIFDIFTCTHHSALRIECGLIMFDKHAKTNLHLGELLSEYFGIFMRFNIIKKVDF